MYIVSNRILGKETPSKFYLILNRSNSCLEIYERVESESLWKEYPIRKDFNADGYTMYELHESLPCIFGGGGKTETPKGVFNIEKVSSEAYISTYHPAQKYVKFFGYLVVFEDYFIHSDLYPESADIENYSYEDSISSLDKHTAGCIRVSQEHLRWLISHISVGTIIEM